MSYKNIYRDTQASLIRFCRDFGDTHGLEFVNLDATTSAETWPEADFVGMGELNVDIQETDEVTVTFAISTKGDPYLLRMSELVNKLTNELLPGSNVMIYDAETGIIKSFLSVANGVRVGAPISTKTQPLQPIMLRLLGQNRNG